MTPKRRVINLSWFFLCLCFSKSLLIKCSEIRKSWVLFMPSSCLISDLFIALTFCLLALVFISVATVQTEPMGVFYLLF